MKNLQSSVKILINIVLIVLGLLLTSINIYGTYKDIRPAIFLNDELRFANDSPLPFKEALQQIIKNNNETNLEYSGRLTKVVSKSIAHIHWEKYSADKFNQLIPIWENYLLYFMGKFSNIPEFKKYHFADYKRSLQRGIGICGDASMIMSQLLNKNGIENQIITFPGHVIVAAKFSSNSRELLFDADFGVTLPFSPDEIKQSPSLVNEYYLQAGYFAYDVKAFNRIYNNDYKRWDGVKHFITNKYYFEKLAYFLKWPLPAMMMLFSIYSFRNCFKSNHKLSITT